jgi:hypothetical protein
MRFAPPAITVGTASRSPVGLDSFGISEIGGFEIGAGGFDSLKVGLWRLVTSKVRRREENIHADFA